MREGLATVEEVGDKFKFTHAENVEPLALHCKEMRKSEADGWSKKRGFRLIARIPAITFFDRKELTRPDGKLDKKEIKKFLQSPEGEIFKTVERGI